MKNRTSLALIELTVMILIFALTAALCLQAFLWSDQTSKDSAARDDALRLAQNGAELIKAGRGDFGGLKELQELPEIKNGGMTIEAKRMDSGVEGLGKAQVSVMDSEGKVLYSLPVSWQEPLAGGETE